jgi:CRP-like cAMP-binding protein
LLYQRGKEGSAVDDRADPRSAVAFRLLLKSVGSSFATVHYPRRAIIFCQGEPCDTVMHIEAGRARLAVTTADGKEGISGLLEQGEFLGEEVLSGHAVRRQTATAMIDTDVIVVAKAQMMTLLHTQPAIEDRFIASILARHTRLEAALTDQLLCSTEQRLAHALVELAGCDKPGSCCCVLPGLSQELIAEMIGTTRSRVNIFMGRFKKMGLVEADGGGTIRVRPALVRLVNGDRPRISAAGTAARSDRVAR